MQSPKIHPLFIALLSIGLTLHCISCSKDNDGGDPNDQDTDYSDSNNWLQVAGSHPAKPVDVFFLYPTTYMGMENFGAVTDPGMRERAIFVRYEIASAYEDAANLFMPYYRQMSAPFALGLSAEEQDQWMRKVPVKDVIAAFEYYLEHYSSGRPFILAGHSQGSNTMLYLLEHIKTNPQLMNRLVAAYAIGWSVTSDYLTRNPPLKFAEGPTDTRVIISWNTESPGVTADNPVLLPGAISINPISWTRGETLAAKESSLGARFFEAGRFVAKPRFADAQVNSTRGIVVCSTVDPEDYRIPDPIFPLGSLHAGDYTFYYYDIQKNANDRVAAYLQAL